MKKNISFLVFIFFLISLGLIGFSCAIPEVSDEPSDNSSITTSTVSLVKEVAVTPDDLYSYGAFCRVNYLPKTDQFFVTFGGANQNVQQKNSLNNSIPVGGAEGGNGYSYKIYSEDFVETGKNGIIHNGGGDAASVLVGDFYYFLAGGSLGWMIEKIDTKTWKVVEKVDIATEVGRELLNDQMLAYANGHLVASGLYDKNQGSGGDQRRSDPTKGYATHNRVLSAELDQLDYFILDDTPHINASSLLFIDGVYHYITSSAYFGDLIVMKYDEDWNYLSVKKLEDGGQWPQGAVYDSKEEKFYVAFIDLDLTKENPASGPTNIALGIFDKDWELLEKIIVTDLSENESGGRPWVILQDDRLYVSYDVSTRQANGEENKDWQCLVNIYEMP